MLLALEGPTAPPLVIEIGTTLHDPQVQGLDGLSDGRAILLGTVLHEPVVIGIEPFPNPDTQRPIFLGSVGSTRIVAGITIDEPDAVIAADPYASLIDLTVIDPDGDVMRAVQIGATPQLNDVGSGVFAVPRADRLTNGVTVGINVGPYRFFTGIVTSRSDVQLDPGQEVNELTTHTLSGLLDDWRRVVVLPDYGAQDISRLGRPTQDTRLFDWTMNGLGTDAGDEGPLDLIPSVSRSPYYGTSLEVQPMPDVWPDPSARWMWTSNPGVPVPAGYCYFRVPFHAVGRLQVWGCAYDEAEFYMDGVPIFTCDTPGTAQHLTLDVRDDFHLLTIRAYNARGTAGVLASVLPVDTDTGLFYPPSRTTPWVNSQSGWRSLAYPTRSFRLNPGRVIQRLILEAQRRHATLVGDWVLNGHAEDPNTDSAGTPWPDNPPISVQVGATYLDVLKQLAESLVDFAPDPARRRLNLWVKGTGSTYTAEIPWFEQVDLESRVFETSY